MFSKSILALAGLMLITSPAAAAEQPANKGQPRAPEKTYCLKYVADTGSRLSRTECRTKEEWALSGIDVDELLAK